MASDVSDIPLTAFSQTDRPIQALSSDMPIQAFDTVISSEDIQLVQFQQTATAAVGNNWTDVEYVRSNYGLNGQGQTVAIIDSGIAYDHVALGGGYGAGYKVVGGYDFAEGDNNPYDDGPAGFHGTHVAGIVGSTNSTYTGVAPGVDLVALRVFDDDGGGYFSYVEQALQWVHTHRNSFANPITTVNLSLGTDWNSNKVPNWAMLEDEFAQLEADGIFVSVAAGNSFDDYNTPGLSYPAVSPYVVPVMSHDSNGLLSYFSQRATMAIAAPGRSIVSTVPDHAFGADGVKNDFGSASGTSMAAPYIAGVSSLVRQAMTAFGYSNITQDSIYQQLRDTADTFYDTATKTNYLRVNVSRAIARLSGGDAQGDSANAAQALGTWGGSSIIAKFNSLSDKDYFSFTADQTGVMTLSADSLGGGATTWTLVGGSTKTGNTYKINVVAGQTYTFGVSSSAIGRYTISTSTGGGSSGGDSSGGGGGSATSWGAIDIYSMDGMSNSGTQTYSFTASRTAYFTLEAFQAQGTGVKLEVLNSQGEVIRQDTVARGVGRINYLAREGDQYSLRITGNTSDLDLKMINVLSRDKSGLIVNGTSGDDQISVIAERQLVIVSGVRSSYRNFDSLTVQGNGGNDTMFVVGDRTATEQVTVSTTSLTVSAGKALITAENVENYILRFQDEDSSTIYDGRGNDIVWIADSYVGIKGASYKHRTFGFGYNVVNATAGGNDTGYFYDTAGTPQVNQNYGTITTATSGGKLTVARGIERGYYVTNSQTQSLGNLSAQSLTATPIVGASFISASTLAAGFANNAPTNSIAISTDDFAVSNFQSAAQIKALSEMDSDDGFDLQAASILDSIAELSSLVDKYRRNDSVDVDDFASHSDAADDVLAGSDLASEMLFDE